MIIVEVGLKKFKMSKLAIATGSSLTSALISILYLQQLSLSAMREDPLDAAKHLLKSERYRQRFSFDKDSILKLKNDGYVIFDDVLSLEEVANSRKEVKEMLNNQCKLKFYENGHNNENIRKDKVSWIGESIGESQHQYLLPGLLLVLRILRSIPESLVSNKIETNVNMGVPLSNQLSVYFGNGNNYVAHFDKPLTKRTTYNAIMQAGLHDRRYTIILYLNSPNYTNNVEDSNGKMINDSGSLRITKINGDTENIFPKGGRMIIFNSATIQHEVRPNYGEDRVAITCWVGGEHTKNIWLQKYNIPLDEINWKQVRQNIFNFKT